MDSGVCGLSLFLGFEVLGLRFWVLVSFGVWGFWVWRFGVQAFRGYFSVRETVFVRGRKRVDFVLEGCMLLGGHP